MKSTQRLSICTLSLVLATVAYCQVSVGSSPVDSSYPVPNYRVVPFEFPADSRRIYTRDLDGDSRVDFVVVRPSELNVLMQTNDGFDFGAPLTIPLPHQRGSWDVAKLDKERNVTSFMILNEGHRIDAFHLNNGELTGPEPLLSNIDVFVPEDVRRVNFVQDLNTDGRADFILPSMDELTIYLRTDRGTYQPSKRIGLSTETSTTTTAPVLLGRVGQRVAIPRFQVNDINNDGLRDFVLHTNRKLHVSLANAELPTYFPDEPSIERDFAEYYERSQQFRPEEIDYSDLLSNIAPNQHSVMFEDIDNDDIHDLVVFAGNKLFFYRGTVDGVAEKPTQVLRLSSSVFAHLLSDYDGDGEVELLAFKGPQISIGRVLLNLAIPQTWHIDLLVYRLQNGVYSRQPSASIAFTIKVPGILGMIPKIKQIEEATQQKAREGKIPLLYANLDGNATLDLLTINDGAVELYWNLDQQLQAFDIDSLKAALRQNMTEIEVDVRQLIGDLANFKSSFDLISDLEPLILDRLDTDINDQDFLSRNLNNDGFDDIFIFVERTDELVSGKLMLSNGLGSN